MSLSSDSEEYTEVLAVVLASEQTTESKLSGEGNNNNNHVHMESFYNNVHSDMHKYVTQR